MNKLFLNSIEQKLVVPEFDEQVLFSLERRYLDLMNLDRLELAENNEPFEHARDLRLVKVQEVGLDADWPSGLYQLNMQNIFSALNDPRHNVVGVITGDADKSSVYFGVARRSNFDGNQLHDMNGIEQVLPSLLQGNFHNVKCHPLSASEIRDEINFPILSANCMAAMSGMPSRRFAKDRAFTFQNLDRFIEGMRGQKYTLMLIAEPIALPEIDAMTSRLFNLSSDIHAQAKATVQRSKGSSDTVNVGMFGLSGNTAGESQTKTTSSGETRMGGGGAMTSGGAAAGALVGAGIGSIIPGLGTAIGAAIGAAVGTGAGAIVALLSGAPLSSMSGLASSFTRSVAQTTAQGAMGGYARSWNRSSAVSYDVLNKKAEYAEELCDRYIDRLKAGKSLGFWNLGVYLLCENDAVLRQGAGLLRSQLAGDETHWEPIRMLISRDLEEVRQQYLLKFKNPLYNLLLHGEQTETVKESIWAGKLVRLCADRLKKNVKDVWNSLSLTDENATKKKILGELEKLRKEIPKESVTEEEIQEAWDAVQKANVGHPLGPVMGGVSTPVNTEELAIAFNLPLTEVRGVGVRESAHFGVNVVAGDCAQGVVDVGLLIHKREIVKKAEVVIGTENLTKHCFVSGVTGSGKTTTTQNILRQIHIQDVPFLVIEPAKCEYRRLLESIPDLKVFTLGDETVSPFRINPFDFERHGGLLTHIDYLKSVFNASFPMYASMPYLLEDTICQVYLDKGWELGTSTNRYIDVQRANEETFSDYLPTMEDLYNRVDSIVEEKKYGQQLHMDLSAALRARISSLLTGSKGLMLNTRRSIPIADLMRQPVVLELKNLGDDDEKTFMMGLIFMRIYESLTVTTPASITELRHLVVIEEAHRLLKHTPENISPEIGNMRGKAVEAFCNCLAEVRSYGLGVVIADQIPSKLAPDVIKNTNTKIVHKLLALDDRNMVGDAMGLSEAQKRELAFLQPGQAVVLDDRMNKAVLLQVITKQSGSLLPVSDDSIRAHMAGYRSSNLDIFTKLPGTTKSSRVAELINRLDVRRFNLEFYRSAVGFITALIAGQPDEVRAVATFGRRRLASPHRKDDPDVPDAQFLYYTAHFFKKLNESRPDQLDVIIELQRKTGRIWFDLAELSNTEVKNASDSFRAGMKRVNQSDDPLESIAQWQLACSDSGRTLAAQLKAVDASSSYSVLEEFLDRLARDLLLEVDELSNLTLLPVKHSLLRQLLAGNPRAGEIERRYIERGAQ